MALCESNTVRVISNTVLAQYSVRVKCRPHPNLRGGAGARRAPRGDRRPLTRDAIVEAALRLLDREGIGRAEHAQAGAGARRRRRLALLARARQGGAARPAARPHRRRERACPTPTRRTGGSRSRSWGARTAGCCSAIATRRRSRSAAIPIGPELDAGARAQPRRSSWPRAAAARDRARRRHVRPLRRRLRVRGEHATADEPADAGAARRVLPLAAARRVPDARRARRRPHRRRAPTSASSSRIELLVRGLEAMAEDG